MIEMEINEKNLVDFIENIRPEDKEELEYTFNKEYKKNFIDICLREKHIWFLADDNNNPCAIGGIQYEQGKINQLKKGRVWFLSTLNFKKNSIFILKYIKNKISEFKKNTDILYNYIYKTNFNFLKFLKNQGFKTIDINNDMKIFYCYKGGEQIDLRHTTR